MKHVAEMSIDELLDQLERDVEEVCRRGGPLAIAELERRLAPLSPLLQALRADRATRAFTCPRCSAISHNPNDLTHGYCGRCHAFTAQPTPSKEAAPIE